MTPSHTMSRSVRRSGHVLCQDDGGDAVLLDLAGERYFGLNRVGTRIWQLLETPSSLATIHGALCAEFDAPTDRIEHDLLTLVEQLQSAGLIVVE